MAAHVNSIKSHRTPHIAYCCVPESERVGFILPIIAPSLLYPDFFFMDFSQSVAVVTGAGSGIGQHLALQLSKTGARVAINDYDSERLAATSEQIQSQGGTVFSQAFDVSDKEEMHRFAKEVEREFGQVDVMVNNAGVALGQMTMDDVTYEDFRWIVEINLWGVIHGTLAFLPLLRERPQAKLVNVCSSFGLLAVPEQTPYCTAKFAVRGFTDSLRLELMDTNIRVSLVCPSQVRTNIVRYGRHKDEAARHDQIEKFDTVHTRITPSDAATTILDGLRKNREFILVGSDAKLFNIASRFVPRFIIKRFTRRELKRIASLETSPALNPAE